jgi:capsular polysaccharide biosynthesis protein
MGGLSDFLGDALAPGRRRGAGRRVYATRRQARHRYVANEDDVAALLESHGFETVENERLSLDEQIALYAETSILVGVMGANLTNVLFMEPRSAVLQLTRMGDASNHLYYSLASSKGVRFYYQQSLYVDAGWGIRWNLTVDLDELEANLTRILADPPESSV